MRQCWIRSGSEKLRDASPGLKFRHIDRTIRLLTSTAVEGKLDQYTLGCVVQSHHQLKSIDSINRSFRGSMKAYEMLPRSNEMLP